VHGSRVVEVVRGTTSHTEPFEEQTSTMIVFPLGGVLKMSTQVGVGQAIVLTNLKTHQDAICRVVKTRTNPNLHSYVEVEFSHPQPGYWGVRFPSDAPEPAQKAASSAAPSVPAPVASAPVAPAISAPAPKIEIARPEISKTDSARTEHQEPKVAAPAPLRIEKPAPAIAPPPASPATAAPVEMPAASSFSLDQLRGDAGAASSAPLVGERSKSAETHLAETRAEAESSAAHEMPVAHEASTFGRFAASSASSGENAPARPAFGAGLEYGSLGATSEKSQTQGKNGALIAACVALLLVAAGGGGYYFLHLRPIAQRTAATVPVSPAAPANPISSPVAANPAPAEQAPAVAAPAPNAAMPAKSAAASPLTDSRSRQPEVNEPAPSKPAQAPSQARASEPEKQRPSQAVPDMFGALNAHPTTAVRSGNTESGAAPSIGSGALAGGQGIALPSSEPAPANLAPPPQPAAEGPVRVGGDVKPPQLISAPPVVYPEIAHQAGIDGDVVVRIVIDKSGKVTEAKAITGPVLLRDAAVTALRGRKYVPSKLDGRPISIEMLVTIQFHR